MSKPANWMILFWMMFLVEYWQEPQKLQAQQEF